MKARMTEYWLVTVWRIEAPLAVVYAAVCDPLNWPAWWPDAQRIEQCRAGADDGVGRVLRCTWRGRLPYRLSFDLRTTRMQPLQMVEGEVDGDLQGSGRCRFTQEGNVTTVCHEWRVRTTPAWMNRLARCTRPLFKRNHALAMQRGGEGLARSLNARLLDLTCHDMGRTDERRADARWAAASAGLLAGIVATAVQMLLWGLAGAPVLATLSRDARLTAAMLLGQDVLSPSASLWLVLPLASSVHFALSIAYGLLLAPWLGRLRAGPALLVGGACGLALYGINLYGFTALFPWFAVARGWITGAAHLAFGIAMAGGSYLAQYPATGAESRH